LPVEAIGFYPSVRTSHAAPLGPHMEQIAAGIETPAAQA
jgi:hypothetical protein